MVTFDTVEAFASTTQAAEDVATANDDADLHTHLVDFLDLCSIFVETLCVDAVTLLPHKAFATEFKQDAIEFHIIEK